MHGIEEEIYKKNEAEKSWEDAIPCSEEYNNCCSQHNIEFTGNRPEPDRQRSDEGAYTQYEADIGNIAPYDITREDIRMILK